MKKNIQRTIVIGDVHGCAEEMEDLLEKVSPGERDKVVLLGDLVNRGPFSHRVVEIAREQNFLSLMGNHELRLLQYRQTKDPTLLRTYDFDTLQKLKEEDWHYLQKMQAFYETPDSHFVCVHGGFLPGPPWRTQPLHIVCQTNWIPMEEIPPLKRIEEKEQHWSTLWEEDATALYGHTPYKEVKYIGNTLGIDTSCVYGGFLTACILPDMEIIQVRARKAYI